MAQNSADTETEKIALFNAKTGNILIGVAKTGIGGVLVLASLIAMFTRPFQVQVLGLLLVGAVLILIGAIDLRRSADRSVKIEVDRLGLRDHRSGLKIPWSAVTGVTYNPKTTPSSSAMLRLSLCPFASSGLTEEGLPAVLAAWPRGRSNFSLEMTSLSYNEDSFLADITRLSGIQARNILRKLPPV